MQPCRISLLVLAASLCAAISAAAPLGREKSEMPASRVGERDGVPVWRKEVFTSVFEVDQIFKSMKGPYDTHSFALEADETPELLWVTGFEAVMVSPDGSSQLSQEFMCHSNLALQGLDHYKRFRTRIPPSVGRIFSLAQGQLSIELPEGVGVPIMSDQPIQIVAQVLNHNVVDETVEVRHRISVTFVRDRDLESPLLPVHPRAVYGMKLVEGPDGFYGVAADEVDPMKHGEGCLIGEDAGGVSRHVNDDGAGRKFTGFWNLPPGREVNHTLVTKLLDLPYDTTLHYVAAHLHPFAESLELRDITAGKTVYKTRTRQVEEGVGLAEVEYFSSREGVPLYKDHEYELISVYDNTSGKTQDAMATLFLYVHLRDLEPAALRPPASAAAGNGVASP